MHWRVPYRDARAANASTKPNSYDTVRLAGCGIRHHRFTTPETGEDMRRPNVNVTVQRERRLTGKPAVPGSAGRAIQ